MENEQIQMKESRLSPVKRVAVGLITFVAGAFVYALVVLTLYSILSGNGFIH